jgi:hypothetical protein
MMKLWLKWAKDEQFTVFTDILQVSSVIDKWW